MTKREQMGEAIVKFEGRFDKNGNLMVYKLPAGDGGGAFEIAGINERYHRAKAYELKDQIERGHHARARENAGRHIVSYTDPVVYWFDSVEHADQFPHVEFLLRDCAFNRGLKGAAAILQIALGVEVDGVIGPKTKAAFGRDLALDANDLARRITKARETYERTSYPWKTGKRDQSSKFWAGLSNRWSAAHKVAVGLALLLVSFAFARFG